MTTGIREHLLEENSKCSSVRIVEGEYAGQYSTSEALELAEKIGLDLVVFNEQANKEAICRLIDYDKFMFDKKKRAKEAAKAQKSNSLQNKEIKIEPFIHEHDLDTKINKIVELIADGSNITVKVMYKGRARRIIDTELAEKILNSITEKCGEVKWKVRQYPKIEGNDVIFVIASAK